MRYSVLLVAFGLSIASARADLALDGFMVNSGHPLFVLSDEKAKESDWITIGQVFEGFKVVAFDPKLEVLVVEKDGKRQELRLRESNIRDANAEDRKARLKSLKGMELAYEVAKGGNQEMTDLLERYQECLLSLEDGRPVQAAVDFLRLTCEQKAAEKAAQILAEK